jgi:hypothetical protein
LSIYNFITHTFNLAHNIIHAGMEASHAAEMASISAQYDNGPSTWCVNGPPITPQAAMDDAYYTAQANLEAARLSGQSPGDEIMRYFRCE